ncbi:MAG: thioesterase [Treponema sp.]|nr:thioesterase [Treponema sp.]
MNCDPSNPKGSGIVDVWQENAVLRFGAIDRSDKLTLDVVFQFFQEAAISHAENLGVGREDMAKAGQGWILSRITVFMKKRPKYGETVTIRSWPQGWEKLFAIRNYEIKDKDNVPVVSARSAWIIVDIEKRRPLRPQAIMDNMPQNKELISLTPEENGAVAVTQRDNLVKITERKALYSDLDYNGHVNNARYVQWIEDALGIQYLEKAEKMRLDINYLNEILENEDIEIFSAKIDDESASQKPEPGQSELPVTFAFEGRKKENSQAAFRAELKLWS